jgi:ATP-binding cassette subfamily C protein
MRLTAKAAASIVTSFIDIAALIIFAQLLSSLVLNDLHFLVKIAKLIGLYREGMAAQDIYLISILLIIFLVTFKSVLILTVNRSILKSLAEKYQESTSEVSNNFFKMFVTEIKAQPSYEVFLAVNSGLRDIFIIGTSASINIVTEVIVVSVIFAILIVHGGLSSLVLAAYFLIAFLFINKFSGSRSRRNSEILAGSNLSAAVTVQAIVESFREIRVFNSLKWFLDRHQSAAEKSSDATVDLQFTVFIPKVILESTFVIGIAAFTWYKITNGEISTAVVEVGFLVAMGSRIIPSLLRLQFSIYQFKQVVGSSVFTMRLLNSDQYKAASLGSIHKQKGSDSIPPMTPKVTLEELSYTYPGTDNPAVSNLNLAIEPGESIGIVGRTGSGKSTLVDLLLGALEPSDGSVSISGTQPVEVFNKWGGSVGFVPQNISLIDGTLRENLLLGREGALYSDEDCRHALNFAGLSSHIDSLPSGLETIVTRAGSELSGGQRQKLGIARAVLTKPSLLILDEVTSSLDAESENVVNAAIAELKGKVTLIVVAHRITTIKSMDRILQMENGKIAAIGSYDELIQTSPTFKSFVELSEL